MSAALSVRPGRHDHAEPRQSKRSGRERGCWTYIPAEQLAALGIDPNGPAPFYVTTASNNRGRRVFVRLYPERP
jgi:hypothetical protein